MKAFKVLVSLIIGSLALSGCVKEKPVNKPEIDPDMQYLSIAVAVPGIGLTSRAVDEDVVTSIDVFMFDQVDGLFSTVVHYEANELTSRPGYKGTVWSGDPVGTTEGDKYIVAGVNLTEDMVAKMKTLICKPDGLIMFEHTLEELTEGTQGMVMFSATAEPLKKEQFYNTPEEAKQKTAYAIDVNRGVAKTAVIQSDDMEIDGGGTYENLMFGWANVNKKLAYVPKITVNGSEVTPDYGWASIEKYSPVPAIPLYAEGVTPTEFAYAQENLLPYDAGAEEQLTRLRITGNYIPEKLSYLDGDHIAQDDNTSQTPVTFFTLEALDDTFYYFTTRSLAQEVLNAAGTGSVPEFKTNVGDNGIRTYKDGACYFDALINNEASGVKKNNIVRNTYYRIKLNTIKAPGLPGNGTDPGSEYDQWIGFSVKVLDWVEVREDIDID